MIKNLQNVLSQLNDSTRDPIFVVYEKRKFPIDPKYSDKTPVYVNTSSGDYEEISEEEYEKLEEKWDKWWSDKRTGPPPQWDEDRDFRPGDWEEVRYEEINEFKTLFFTRAAAEEYITKNSHNLRLPFIDTDSCWRNEELTNIRAGLIKLAEKELNSDLTA